MKRARDIAQWSSSLGSISGTKTTTTTTTTNVFLHIAVVNTKMYTTYPEGSIAYKSKNS